MWFRDMLVFEVLRLASAQSRLQMATATVQNPE